MQSIAKLVKGASPLVALLFVVMTSFSGGLLITMANGSASPLFSCEVIKGIGNTTLTNASLLEGAGKVPLGLKCSGTKSQTQTATTAVVSNGVKSSGVKSNSVKSSSSGKPSTNGSAPSPFFSCDVVKGTGNTKLTISLPLQGALMAIHFGLNCKAAGVNITGSSSTKPKAKTRGLTFNDFDDSYCTIGQGNCVAIACSSGGQSVPCLVNGQPVDRCRWTPGATVNGCVYD